LEDLVIARARVPGNLGLRNKWLARDALLVLDNVEQKRLVPKVGIDLCAGLGESNGWVEWDGVLEELERHAEHIAIQSKEHGLFQKVDTASNSVSLRVPKLKGNVLLTVAEIQEAVVTVVSPRVQIPSYQQFQRNYIFSHLKSSILIKTHTHTHIVREYQK